MASSSIVTPLCNRGQMRFSRWSRHELISPQITDHWAKQRRKSFVMAQLPTGHSIAFCKPPPNDRSRASSAIKTDVVILPGQTLAPVGDPYYNSLIVQTLHNPALVQPRPPTDSRHMYERGKITPSVYYERARLGRQYWYQEPASKSYG
jgi:hypothetical protein